MNYMLFRMIKGLNIAMIPLCTMIYKTPYLHAIKGPRGINILSSRLLNKETWLCWTLQLNVLEATKEHILIHYKKVIIIRFFMSLIKCKQKT